MLLLVHGPELYQLGFLVHDSVVETLYIVIVCQGIGGSISVLLPQLGSYAGKMSLLGHLLNLQLSQGLVIGSGFLQLSLYLLIWAIDLVLLAVGLQSLSCIISLLLGHLDTLIQEGQYQGLVFLVQVCHKLQEVSYYILCNVIGFLRSAALGLNADKGGTSGIGDIQIAFSKALRVRPVLWLLVIIYLGNDRIQHCPGLHELYICGGLAAGELVSTCKGCHSGSCSTQVNTAAGIGLYCYLGGIFLWQ